MTEKRFYTEGWYVMQDKEVYVICNGEHNADVVATALNESLDKIEQLKQSNQVLSDMCDEYLSSKDFLEHENEWLKKEHKRIQNKVCRLLNHLCDVEGCITREQAKEWWNNEIGDSEWVKNDILLI